MNNLEKIKFEVPENVRNALATGTVYAYDAIELINSIISAITKSYNKNLNNIQEFADDIESWSKKFEAEIRAFVATGDKDALIVGWDNLKNDVKDKITSGLISDVKLEQSQNNWILSIISSKYNDNDEAEEFKVNLSPLIENISGEDKRFIYFNEVITDTDIVVENTSSTDTITYKEVVYLKANKHLAYKKVTGDGIVTVKYYRNWKNANEWFDVNNQIPYPDTIYIDLSTGTNYVKKGFELITNITTAGGAGLTSEQLSKLNGIEAGAQVNTITSVNGQTGEVSLEPFDLGLGNVDNTKDSDKIVKGAKEDGNGNNIASTYETVNRANNRYNDIKDSLDTYKEKIDDTVNRMSIGIDNQNAKVNAVLSETNNRISEIVTGEINTPVKVGPNSKRTTDSFYIGKGAVLSEFIVSAKKTALDAFIGLTTATLKSEDGTTNVTVTVNDEFIIPSSGKYYFEVDADYFDLFADFHITGSVAFLKDSPLPAVEHINEESNHSTTPTSKAVVDYVKEKTMTIEDRLSSIEEDIENGNIGTGGGGNTITINKSQTYNVKQTQQTITSKINTQEVTLNWTLPESAPETEGLSFHNNYVSGSVPKQISGKSFINPSTVFSVDYDTTSSKMMVCIFHIVITAGAINGNDKGKIKFRGESGAYYAGSATPCSESCWCLVRFTANATSKPLLSGTSSTFAGYIDKAYCVGQTAMGISTTDLSTVSDFGPYEKLMYLDVVPGQDYNVGSSTGDIEPTLTIVHGDITNTVQYPVAIAQINANDKVSVDYGSVSFTVNWKETQTTTPEGGGSGGGVSGGSGLSKAAITAILTLFENTAYISNDMKEQIDILRNELNG